MSVKMSASWMPSQIHVQTLYICKNLNSNQQHHHSINETEQKTLWQQHYDYSDWDQKQLQADWYESFR